MEIGLRGRQWLKVMAALAVVCASLLPSTPVVAQERGQAGLVIVEAGGSSREICVDLPEGQGSGYDLLVEAGLAIQSDQAAMGAIICSIEGTGCDFPAESCFCQCESGPCTYWSYWRQDEAGEWQYANVGASGSHVKAGGMEAWVWGEGTTATAPEPPALVFADVCSAAEAIDPAVSVSNASASINDGATAGDEVVAAAAPEEVPAGTAVDHAWMGLALVAIVPLALLGLLLWRRRGPAAT
jgi:hypothetical protein